MPFPVFPLKHFPAKAALPGKVRGFSLIELLIVVGILGILLALALPAYRDYLIKANRSAAQSVLLEIVSREERYAATARAYASSLADLGVSLPADVDNNYTVTLTPTVWCSDGSAPNASEPYCTSPVVAMTGFTATATPKAGSNQVSDGALSINQFGLRTRAGGGSW